MVGGGGWSCILTFVVVGAQLRLGPQTGSCVTHASQVEQAVFAADMQLTKGVTLPYLPHVTS